MKIATWNIERPTSTTKKNAAIEATLRTVNADILILTETNEFINPGIDYNVYHTDQLPLDYYKKGERRVSIYTKYDLIASIPTFRSNTSICKVLKTPFGNLAIYGTVIGITGNRSKDFIPDLDQHIIDFKEISKENDLCISGDLNMSFSDNYYYTKEGRLNLQNCFHEAGLLNLTEAIANNIDHIILPKKFIGERKVETETWNSKIDRSISDHMGVAISISE